MAYTVRFIVKGMSGHALTFRETGTDDGIEQTANSNLTKHTNQITRTGSHPDAASYTPPPTGSWSVYIEFQEKDFNSVLLLPYGNKKYSLQSKIEDKQHDYDSE